MNTDSAGQPVRNAEVVNRDVSTMAVVLERLGPQLGSRARQVLIAVELVVGVGALYGGFGLLRNAEGLGVKESWLEGGPFPDYRVPGVVLLVVVGGGLLTAAVVSWRRPSLAALLALAAAVILVGWGFVETAVVGYHGWPQLVLLALFVVGPAVLFVWLAILSVGVRRRGEATGARADSSTRGTWPRNLHH